MLSIKLLKTVDGFTAKTPGNLFTSSIKVSTALGFLVFISKAVYSP